MYVCFSNVNFINTMIIMKKIIYLVLLALITGLVAQAQERKRPLRFHLQGSPGNHCRT